MTAPTIGLRAWDAARGQLAHLRKMASSASLGVLEYPSSPGNPAAVAELMTAFLALGGHEFWPDDVSLFNAAYVDTTRLLNSAQITDSYLLALIGAHGGKLTTLNRRMVTAAVTGGSRAIHQIP